MTDQTSNILAGEGNAAASSSRKALVFEDAALVDQTRKGDMRAFGTLVAKYQDRIFNMVLRMCANRADNLALSQRRRAGRIKFQSMTGLDDQGASQADRLTAALAARRQSSPEKQAMSAETARRVGQAIEELDDEFRLVVILRDMEGMDYAEIAEVTGAAGGTVKSRLHRGRLSLREKLADLVEVR